MYDGGAGEGGGDGGAPTEVVTASATAAMVVEATEAWGGGGEGGGEDKRRRRLRQRGRHGRRGYRSEARRSHTDPCPSASRDGVVRPLHERDDHAGARVDSGAGLACEWERSVIARCTNSSAHWRVFKTLLICTTSGVDHLARLRPERLDDNRGLLHEGACRAATTAATAATAASPRPSPSCRGDLCRPSRSPPAGHAACSSRRPRRLRGARLCSRRASPPTVSASGSRS